MFAFNPGVNDTSGQILGQGMVSSAQTRADAGVKMVDDIGGALVSLAGAYGQARDKKAVLKGMDQTMGAMSDMEILPKGFLNHYNQLDEDTRPFIFQTLASPMFQAYQKKQGYMDYAPALQSLTRPKATARYSSCARITEHTSAGLIRPSRRNTSR
jgi:hypothetical protein